MQLLLKICKIIEVSSGDGGEGLHLQVHPHKFFGMHLRNLMIFDYYTFLLFGFFFFFFTFCLFLDFFSLFFLSSFYFASEHMDVIPRASSWTVITFKNYGTETSLAVQC